MVFNNGRPYKPGRPGIGPSASTNNATDANNQEKLEKRIKQWFDSARAISS